MANKQNEERKYFNIGKNWEVDHVRVLDFGTFFTLKVDGLSLYNLRVVPAGKKYDTFIASPEEKGKDGKYYKVYALYLDNEDTAAVIEEVERQAKKANRK